MAVHLDPGDREGIEAYLARRSWLPANARVVGVGRAGEGNMNLVLRVTLEGGDGPSSLIVKQARPWVEKYPEIAAPAQRLLVEADFYRAVDPFPELTRSLPGLRHVDSANRIAVLEDLGEAADYTDLYAGASMPAGDERALLDWLARLHRAPLAPSDWPRLRNRAMRELNHAHVFEIPFRAHGGVDLDAVMPGLGDVASDIRRDGALHAAVRALGERYLEDGTSLLHGDFYPGSWLSTPQGPMIIDAEFAFFGPPEFDVGVYLAHRLLAGADRSGAEEALRSYPAPAHFDPALAWRFAGVEVLRRLLGVAQLPLTGDLECRRRWVTLGRRLVLSGDPGANP